MNYKYGGKNKMATDKQPNDIIFINDALNVIEGLSSKKGRAYNELYQLLAVLDSYKINLNKKLDIPLLDEAIEIELNPADLTKLTKSGLRHCLQYCEIDDINEIVENYHKTADEYISDDDEIVPNQIPDNKNLNFLEFWKTKYGNRKIKNIILRYSTPLS